MNLLAKSLMGVLSAAIASTFIASAANAQIPYSTYQPLGQEFIDTASRTSGGIYKNQSLLGQLSTYFGLSWPWPGSINAFPETLVADDAKAVNQLYREALLKQVASDPLIRTPDLINPYNTSILSNPSYTELNQSTSQGSFNTGFPAR